jgi:hypothetical protein
MKITCIFRTQVSTPVLTFVQITKRESSEEKTQKRDEMRLKNLNENGAWNLTRVNKSDASP